MTPDGARCARRESEKIQSIYCRKATCVVLRYADVCKCHHLLSHADACTRALKIERKRPRQAANQVFSVCTHFLSWVRGGRSFHMPVVNSSRRAQKRNRNQRKQRAERLQKLWSELFVAVLGMCAPGNVLRLLRFADVASLVSA